MAEMNWLRKEAHTNLFNNISILIKFKQSTKNAPRTITIRSATPPSLNLGAGRSPRKPRHPTIQSPPPPPPPNHRPPLPSGQTHRPVDHSAHQTNQTIHKLSQNALG